MTAMIAPPRLEPIARPAAADLEVDRLLGRLRGHARRLVGARRHPDRRGVPIPPGYAYLRRAEDDYDEVLGRLHAARREAQARALVA